MSGVVYAQSLDSLFVTANKLYQQESYDEALSLYQEIENNNVESAALYYNMANIYYKTNQVAPSIYYYEKAIKLEPNNKDITFNLEFAKRMTLDNIEALPKSLGQKFRDGIILRFTYNTWAIIAVSLAFLFALLFLLYHFSYSTEKKRIYFITSILAVIFVSLSSFFALKNYQYQETTITAIIFALQTQVKSAPTNSSEVNFELHEGTKVFVLESLDNWRKIKIADGKTGWMKEADLREL
ncbi:Aerotolerance protein BatE [hydrothermal vent metagenome]|uniref:Aerotolerance protein BatE n=1 Tax=hydrothermal vent metagenome TaxID=652676 RepID=A0A3B0QUB5_9ZZZZ